MLILRLKDRYSRINVSLTQRTCVQVLAALATATPVPARQQHQQLSTKFCSGLQTNNTLGCLDLAPCTFWSLFQGLSAGHELTRFMLQCLLPANLGNA
mmetsp:Transcript_33211/g.53487  ORF Transcript_33211/g.53487 Transcript_33211/m.53487 type:complete len:98 (-) Transcript_33211:283-576(-)